MVPYMGRLMPVVQVAEMVGIKPSLIYSRLRGGMIDGLLEPPTRRAQNLHEYRQKRSAQKRRAA
jgi:hypothetical protein